MDPRTENLFWLQHRRLEHAEARLRSLQRQVDKLLFVCALLAFGQFVIGVVGAITTWRI